MSKADDMAKALAKAIGENEERQEVTSWLDTGLPNLNYAISGRYDGGFPVGRIVEIFGPESSGKTAIATAAMAQAQKAGGVAGFMDHERSFDASLGEVAYGLMTDRQWVYKKPETFEQSITTAIKAAQTIREGGYIPDEAPIVWVFDSLASMVPQSKWGKDVTEYNMNDTTALARATSSVMPALNQFCEKYQMTALFLNQMRLKPGVMYGDPVTTPGGNAPKFYASVRISIGASKIVSGKGEEQIVLGQEVRAKCIKNKVYRPFQRAKWRFMFQPDGSGKIDITTTLIDYLLDLKALDSSGARITWIDGKSYFKSQLVEKIEKEGLQAELMKLLPADGDLPEEPEEGAA